MINGFNTFLNNWHAGKNERQKLQHLYLLLSIAIVLIAGILSLFSASIGQTMVKVALFTADVFLSNAIVWNLLQATVLSKLTARAKRK
jgi:uncharacterized membrane protein